MTKTAPQKALDNSPAKMSDKPEAPKGYRMITTDHPTAWFQAAEDAWIEGELMGRFEKELNGDARRYYQIKVDAPTKALVAGEDGKSWSAGVVPAGGLVSIDERKAIESLRDVVESGKRHNVWVGFGSKIGIKGGKTFWQISCGVKAL